MTIHKAKKILNDNQIHWNNYMDLVYLRRSPLSNELEEAIKRIQEYLLRGK